MSNSAQHINGSEKLIDAWGDWPSFHDAEIIQCSFERAFPVEFGCNITRLLIHLRQYISIGENTADYQIIQTKSVLAKFVFSSVSDLELSDFNHQNVINSFTVSPIFKDNKIGLLVDIEPAWGLGGFFRCTEATLESVEVLPVI